jgi:excisionase family DNA binding protein
MEEKLLTVDEVASMLDVHVNTVRRRVPHIKVGRLRRYSKRAVAEWAKEQTVDPRRKKVADA